MQFFPKVFFPDADHSFTSKAATWDQKRVLKGGENLLLLPVLPNRACLKIVRA